MRIAIVGVCASGKTTLVAGLRAAGYDAYNVAQEHSCIHDFWNKHHPDVLVMIDATLPAIHKRRLVYWARIGSPSSTSGSPMPARTRTSISRRTRLTRTPCGRRSSRS